ncbi:MAG: hypothetical protein HQK52_20090 [Oligoflexia bacterium]|nr:hypothetical protein [Oligoflexia bacterium]
MQPLKPESHFEKLSTDIDLTEVFCSRYDRRILKGHRFSFGNKKMIIDTEKLNYSLVGRDVEVRVYKEKPPRFICNGIDLIIKDFVKENEITFQLYAKLQDKFAA